MGGRSKRVSDTRSKAQIVGAIMELPGFPGKFGPRSIGLTLRELESLLVQLKDPKARTGTKRRGVARPDKEESPSERVTKYRERMSEYIEAMSGLRVPGSSSVCARFYDALADYLDPDRSASS